ncbi:transglycosylase domain-containing protein [Fusobacterium sp.]|uniref:transglycosylase domain-containing protein n=1 Tax=Fusobacterium sp. TaxID=68766 RepID=UPI00396C9042
MKLKNFFKFLLAIFILIGILSAGTGFYILNKYYKELPDISNIIEEYSPSIPSTVYDRKGRVIDVISKETRDIATFKEIPSNVKNAFLAIEDKQFYKHYGIHFKRLAGAVVANLKSGRAVQGASSFTQQLARNAFLSHEKSIDRKIKEALITFEIERKYTKDEIFEKYLNEIYFGGGAYGIKTAASRFFRKDVSQLNLPEAAMLAGIPNRPEKYNPSRKLNNAIERMKLILSEMYKDGMITEEEYKKALEHKFYNDTKLPADFVMDKNTTIVYNDKNTVQYNVPDFSNMVIDILGKEFDENTLYTGGLKIYTTLDLDIQKVAKETFEKYPLLKQKDMQGGMITIDPNNGEVIAVVAGKNFKIGGFNRATMAKRQLGSSFKPFLYFTAIQNGYDLNTIVEDRYLQYGKWIPKNYGSRYNKNMTLLTALDRSVNTVSVQLLEKVGIKTFKDNMKILDPDLKIPDNLTASLGAVENTPLQQALDYSIFANGGYKIEPVVVTSVVDKYGNLLYEKQGNKEKIYDSLDTSLITYMLKSSVIFGSSSRASVYDANKRRIEQGGKTGTTNENRTLWFAGITPNYVTTIYIGYDNNRPIRGRISGGTAVAPLWANFYQALVNKGLYDTTAKFSFLENYLKSGELLNETLSLTSGLRVSNGRNFIMKRGKVEIETAEKYSKGIQGICESMGFSSGGFQISDQQPQQNSNPGTNTNIQNTQQQSNDDPLLQRLLGN